MKLNMMESFETFQNKGKVIIDINFFPQLKGKDSSAVADWVADNLNNLWIDGNSGEVFPSQTTTKQEFIKENGLKSDISDEDLKDEGYEGDYVREERVSLRDYFSDASVDFDKIVNEKQYFVAD